MKIKNKNRLLKIKNEYLQLIHDLIYDYDGETTVKGLQELLDEVDKLVTLAYTNNDTEIFYTNGIKNLNILHEEIKDKC